MEDKKMADHDFPSESNNFEFVNDNVHVDDVAEKIGIDDHFGSSGQDDIVTSTQHDMPEEDSYTKPVESSEPHLDTPLIDLNLVEREPEPSAFEKEPSPVQPLGLPDSTDEPKEEFVAKQADDQGQKTEKSVTGGTWLKHVDPRAPAGTSYWSRVVDLIYWRDLKKTGIVFGSTLVCLLSLALFSVLSVVAYLSLAALTVTISFVVYKKVIGAVQKTPDAHPFKPYLEMDFNLPEEKVQQIADVINKHLTTTSKELRRLFMVEDIIDSLKFGLLLWVLTYIGAWFNGMSLLILVVVMIFTLPKFYETYKVQIDQYLDIAKTNVKNITKKIQEKIPLPGKKKQN